MLQFDIYSCKCYNIDIIIEHLNETFDLTTYEWVEIDRNDEIKVVNKYKK